jgi:formate--tetrahydrofolate ligase
VGLRGYGHLCLATDIEDLKARLDRIIVGSTLWGRKVTAQDIKVSGSMAVLLKDAFMPNLVQTLKTRRPSFMAAPSPTSPMAATRCRPPAWHIKLGDYCVTEAGFGADLGAEKFFDIKCRYAGLRPDCVVLGGDHTCPQDAWGRAFCGTQGENLSALAAGLENLEKHLENMKLFGPL